MKRTLFALLATLPLATLACRADAPKASLTFGAAEPVTVIAIAKLKPGNEAAFQDSVAKILAPTRAEAGNVAYNYHVAEDDTASFAFVEQWQDDAAIDTHMASPHMQQFFSEVGNLFQPGYPTITRYHRVEK